MGVEDFDHFGKVGQTAGQPVNLVDHDYINELGVNVLHQAFEGRALHVPP